MKVFIRVLRTILVLSILAFPLCGNYVDIAHADGDVLILAADSSPPTAELLNTGLFDSVDELSVLSSTPTLGDLTPYEAVLVYTNNRPQDPSGLGDVLADYVDAGGHLVLCTYGFSTPWQITGRITSTGYSPLINLGTNGNVSGNIVAVVPSDPIFAGIDLNSVTYFHNSNFAHSGLDTGATLLANDGAGILMIARNSSGNIYAANFFPGTIVSGNNNEFYNLIANMLNSSQSIPTLSEWGMIILSLALTVSTLWMIRRRKNLEC